MCCENGHAYVLSSRLMTDQSFTVRLSVVAWFHGRQARSALQRIKKPSFGSCYSRLVPRAGLVPVMALVQRHGLVFWVSGYLGHSSSTLA